MIATFLDPHHRAVLDLAVALETLRSFEDRLEARERLGITGYRDDAERQRHRELVEAADQADAALARLRREEAVVG